MKIVTLTRITIDKKLETEKYYELYEDSINWRIIETYMDGEKYIVTFEKISEVIIT